MTDEELWDRLATETGFPQMVQAIRAQTRSWSSCARA